MERERKDAVEAVVGVGDRGVGRARELKVGQRDHHRLICGELEGLGNVDGGHERG